MSFLYDTYAGGLRIIPRADPAPRLHAGRPGVRRGVRALDRGAADEIHGEGGDDFIYGQVGNDVLFGEGQDDDIIGGYGDDWISGGTGDDGVIGDDGRISTSRNSSPATRGTTRRMGPVLHRQRRRHLPRRAAERHRGAAPDRSRHAQLERQRPQRVHLHAGPDPDRDDQRRGRAQQVDQPDAVQRRPERPDLFDANGYDDIIFGGLGNDFLHGGSGDDAISGAEALPMSYVQLYSNNTTCGQENNDCVIGLVLLDYAHPWNVGDTLHFGADTNPWHSNGHVAARLGEFLLYNEYDPRRAILFQAERHAVELPGDFAGRPHLLRHRRAAAVHAVLPELGRERGPGDQRLRRDLAERQHVPRDRFANSDGNDVIFGDLGNDWLVGGTGNDTLWGGFGNDLMNADDALSTGCIHDGPAASAGRPPTRG